MLAFYGTTVELVKIVGFVMIPTAFVADLNSFVITSFSVRPVAPDFVDQATARVEKAFPDPLRRNVILYGDSVGEILRLFL